MQQWTHDKECDRQIRQTRMTPQAWKAEAGEQEAREMNQAKRWIEPGFDYPSDSACNSKHRSPKGSGADSWEES